MQKPMQTTDELIAHMKNKGINFTVMSEREASAYLDKNNNYFKLSAYRKNYARHTTKNGLNVYEHLDFAYLVELARIDVQLRHVLLGMSLDIEHALKVAVIKAIEKDSTQDGYTIVSEYDRLHNVLAEKIERNKNNPYCGELIKKYKTNMPIWAFVELIAFGDLLRFIDFISSRIHFTLPIEIASLNRVRKIRNASAHNNCIINDLSPVINKKNNKPLWREAKYVTDFMLQAGVNKATMHKKLSNQRFSQIVHLLYVYSNLVQNGKTRQLRIHELQNLVFKRMVENKEYFKSNEILTSTYEVFTVLSKTI